MTSREFCERLVGLAEVAKIVVPPTVIEPLASYFELLSQWNARINLTALPLRPPSDETFQRLLLEPLAAATNIPKGPQNWFDIGSGGGSPAVPLKLARPDLDLSMVEPKERKAAFLRETARVLGLSRTTVFCERLQDLVSVANLRQIATVITVRGVRLDDELLRAARQLIAERGQLLVFCTTESQPSSDSFSHRDTLPLGALGTAKLARYTPCVPRGTNLLTP